MDHFFAVLLDFRDAYWLTLERIWTCAVSANTPKLWQL